MNATDRNAELVRIERAVAARRDGAAVVELEDELSPPVARRTLQLRLGRLVELGRLRRRDRGRAARYVIAPAAGSAAEPIEREAGSAGDPGEGVPLSAAGARTLALVRRPLAQRIPVGHDPDLLDGHVPGETSWLTNDERRRLAATGDESRPAGTHARRILGRLLIDLSWNSSRLEGNFARHRSRASEFDAWHVRWRERY